MRERFVRTLMELAREDKNIVLMTGDLGFGVLKPFWEEFPDQFINAGIAEQNMISAAAGMALAGKTVFVYSIGNFPTLRCLEQIRNSCAYHQANVKIICCGGGLTYGALGMTHHATEELAIMRALPDVTVLSPGDAVEAEAATRIMAATPGTCYMRLGRGGEERIHEHLADFQIGKAIQLREGKGIAVFSTGTIFTEARKACSILRQRGYTPALYSVPTIKPIDADEIRRCAKRYSLIVTCEEHNVIGGLGGAVAEVMAEMRVKRARLLRIGMPDCYASVVGSQPYLRGEYGLDAEQIAKRIEKSYV